LKKLWPRKSVGNAIATIYHGADVSRYQGDIDWASYAAAKDFVIIKAGGGDDSLYTDSKFHTNRSGARAQSGLRIGYYFFGDRSIDAASSANYFISILGTLQDGEILVLDIENHSWGLTPDDDWAFVFARGIYNAFGFYPFVYMSQFSPTSSSLFWSATNTVCPFWMANYGLSSTDFSETGGNADATWGGLASPHYRILQYSASGAISGVPATVDLDTFYSPNNTLADWDALGYATSGNPPPPPPPPPAPGTLTVASVSGPTMTTTEPSAQSFVSTESYDQVLFSTTFNTSVTSSSWPVNIAGPATGLEQYAFPMGNYTYSINNGHSNLNDFGFINAGDYGQFPGTIPTVVVQPIVDSNGGVTFDVVVNNLSGSVTVDLTINIALLAYPETGSIPLSSVTQAVAQSSGSPVTTGGYSSYRRIYQDSSVGTGATTITHNQSTIPNLTYWVQDNSGTIEPQPVTWASDGHTTAFGVSMDATNIYFYVDATNNAKAWYRTYKDN